MEHLIINAIVKYAVFVYFKKFTILFTWPTGWANICFMIIHPAVAARNYTLRVGI
jgi:hypothetical protein